MRKITLFYALLASVSVFAQKPTTSIATWKGNAKGAYNIIHDDYGAYGVDGIQNYADSIATKRGIKFTFGAITSECENRVGIYDIAKKMIAKGHEIINHSHTHSCAANSENCGGTGPNYAWAEPATQRFDIEVDRSSTSISTNTGYTPKFFIFPYDTYNANAENYIKGKGYLGVRTGAYNTAAANNFQADADGFFKTAMVVDVDHNTDGSIEAVRLNEWAQKAIDQNVWVNRELHNVGDTGWGKVKVADYRNHMDFLKDKVAQGLLWVGTVSEILSYQLQKNLYVPTTSYNVSANEVLISWNTPQIDMVNYIGSLQVKSPITLLVNLDGLSSSNLLITQAGKTITDYKVVNGVLQINAYPHEGNIAVQLQAVSGIESVRLNSPYKDQKFNAPATIDIQVAANDPQAKIVKVEFLANNTVIGTDVVAPYALTWNNVAVGAYDVKVRAYDAQNNSFTSPWVTVYAESNVALPTSCSQLANWSTTVQYCGGDRVTYNGKMWESKWCGNGNMPQNPDPSYQWKFLGDCPLAVNAAPVVSLTSPTQISFTAPATVQIAANATDSDGTIAKVEFYANNSLLSTSTQSPYEYVWNNVVTGGYDLKAIAYDNQGKSTVSKIITIDVASNEALPTSCSVLSVWNTTTQYCAGERVSYNGKIWQSKWCGFGNQPQDPDPSYQWKFLGTCQTATAKTAMNSSLVTKSKGFYPNPANVEELNFDAAEEGNLEFFDISGKKILETQVLAGSNTIVSKNIAKGMYFGKFITKNGNEETHKIMIK